MNFKDKFQHSKSNLLGERKQFVHEFVDLPKLERIDNHELGRVYQTPEGNFWPSVTTVLGETEDKSFLVDWKNRIGEDEANKITNQSGRRGTELHLICERYLRNEENYLGNSTPVYYDLFRQIKPKIDESLDIVYGIESGLYSDRLKVSGTTDVVARWDGLKSIVDWKNARWNKKLEDIFGYIIQTDLYAQMFEERTRIEIEQLVIVMAVEGNKAANVFKLQRKDYDQQAIEMVNKYYASHS